VAVAEGLGGTLRLRVTVALLQPLALLQPEGAALALLPLLALALGQGVGVRLPVALEGRVAEREGASCLVGGLSVGGAAPCLGGGGAGREAGRQGDATARLNWGSR
jgi:hypothetical protein